MQIGAAAGTVVEHADCRKNAREYGHGNQQMPAKGSHLCGSQYRQQGHGAARRVQGAQQQHQGNGSCHGQRGQRGLGQRGKRPEQQQGIESRHGVADDTVPGLGQRAAGHGEHQHGRGAQRCEQKQGVGKEMLDQPHQNAGQSQAQACANAGADQLFPRRARGHRPQALPHCLHDGHRLRLRGARLIAAPAMLY